MVTWRDYRTLLSGKTSQLLNIRAKSCVAGLLAASKAVANAQTLEPHVYGFTTMT